MKPKKILAWILTLAMLIPMLSGINLTAMAEETIDTNLYEDMLDKIKEENNYGLSENIDSGTILNAWNWSFDSIADNMRSIAEQGFTAVLVSPPNEIKMATKDKKFQEPSENGVSPNGWWMFYEPVGFQINESSDNALGTKADFVEMCDTAETYGVKIMVDAVVGYMGSDDDHVGEYNNTNPDVMTHISAKIQEFEPEIYAAEAFHNPWVNMTYKMNYWDGYTDYAIEEDLTQHAAGGKPDLATETQLVQDSIYDYLKELLDAGTDGFWFSDVTHIETPSDTHFGSDFWDDTLAKLRDDYPNEEIYAIGEVYNKLGDGREPSDYTGYMDLTYTDVYWPIKNAAQNASYSNESLPVWTDDSYIPQENTVLFVETGLTYTDGGTASLTVEQRNKIWALIAPRKDITSIYFSRPDDTPKSNRAEVESLLGDYTLGYANTSVLSDEVVKNVNHFANYFGNAEEGVYQESDVAVITKTDGSKIVGATVVNLDGTTGAVEINLGNVDDGNYIDSVEGNTFTIEDGVLKGNIGESGVATLYFTGNTYTVTVNEAENGTVSADKENAAAGDEVTLTVTPVDGYELDTLTVKDADNNDVTVTDNKFTMPAKNVTVTATFKAVASSTEYAVTVTNGTGSGEYKVGNTVTITANKPEKDYIFTGWTGLDGLEITEGDASSETVKFIQPEGPVNVTANYGYDTTDDIRFQYTKRFLVIDMTKEVPYIDFSVDLQYNLVRANEKVTPWVEGNQLCIRIDADITTEDIGASAPLSDVDVHFTYPDGKSFKHTFNLYPVEKNNVSDMLICEPLEITYGESNILEATLSDDFVPGENGSIVFLDGEFPWTEDKNKQAGEYTVTVAYEDDVNYGSITVTVTITKATPAPNAEKLTTARVHKNKTLADATVTTGEFFAVDGTTVLEGAFTWVDDTKKITADSTEKMKFTPVDTNYAEIEFDVAVDSYTTGGGGGGSGSSSTTTTTTKNDDGSTTKTTINKATGTTTEVTTGTDGSTTTVETKKDGTVTTTEKDAGGNTTTTTQNPDGSSTTTEKNKDGSETVVEKDTEGTTTTTEKDSEGNKTVTTEKADGTTTTEETRKDGTTVKTETTASGETTAEVEAKGETEVIIPIENADEVTKVVVTDASGNETEAYFEVKDGGVAISVSGNSTVSVQTGHICYAKDFTDVDLDSWYHLNIDYVLENGLMKGTAADKFAPNDNLTRAMLVTVLYRLEGEPRVSGITGFADLEKGGYYLDAVCWAQLNGIVNGVSETEFAPNSNITREQIATIMFRYAQYKGMDAVTLEENLHFVDNDDISEYAVSAMNWAVGTGLMKGKSTTTINPKDNATRAEIAAILHRFIEGNK